MSRLFRTAAGWAVVAAGVVGCAESGPPRGTVAGRVTLGGRPVAGEVTFTAKEIGAAATATLGPAGEFRFDGPLPVGTYQVAVTPAPPTPGDPSKPAAAAPKASLPERYADPDKSGLTAAVNPGANDVALELKD